MCRKWISSNVYLYKSWFIQHTLAYFSLANTSCTFSNFIFYFNCSYKKRKWKKIHNLLSFNSKPRKKVSLSKGGKDYEIGRWRSVMISLKGISSWGYYIQLHIQTQAGKAEQWRYPKNLRFPGRTSLECVSANEHNIQINSTVLKVTCEGHFAANIDATATETVAGTSVSAPCVTNAFSGFSSQVCRWV